MPPPPNATAAIEGGGCRELSQLFVAQRVLGGTSGAALLFYVVLRPRYLPNAMTAVRKLLVTLMSIFIIIHNVCIVILDLRRVVLSGTHSSAECGVDLASCTALQVGTTGALTALTMTYSLMSADRLFEAFAPMLYRTIIVPKAFCIVIMIISSGTALSLMFVFDESEDLPGPSTGDCFTDPSAREPRLALLFVALFLLEVFSAVTYALVIRKTVISLDRSATRKPYKIRVGIVSVRFLSAHILIRALLVVLFMGVNAVARVRLQLHPEQRHSVFALIDAVYIVQWYGLALGAFTLLWRAALLQQRRDVIHVANGGALQLNGGGESSRLPADTARADDGRPSASFAPREAGGGGLRMGPICGRKTPTADPNETSVESVPARSTLSF